MLLTMPEKLQPLDGTQTLAQAASLNSSPELQVARMVCSIQPTACFCMSMRLAAWILIGCLP